MEILRIFSKKWIVPTILVVLGMILLGRLGIWQLDRLQQKQAFNALMHERWIQEPLNLNSTSLPADLDELQYRRVEARGTFDYENQIFLKNQNYYDAPGAVLVTPLVLEDNRAVLVGRGWVSLEMLAPEALKNLEEPPGMPVIGLVQKPDVVDAADGVPPGRAAEPQQEWFRIDLPALEAQMPYELETAVISQLPEEGRTINQYPIREEPTPLDEGNHLSYAIQWFTFALILGFGYIMLVRQQERKAAGLRSSKMESGQVLSPGAEGESGASSLLSFPLSLALRQPPSQIRRVRPMDPPHRRH